MCSLGRTHSQSAASRGRPRLLYGAVSGTTEFLPTLREAAEEPRLGAAMRFASPSGHAFEIYTDMERTDADYPTTGIRPRKLQHVTLRTEDVLGMERFMIEVLGFRLSDRVGQVISWLRCNPDHHGVALIGMGGNGLHHYAFEVEGWAELERLGDHLLANGKRFMFGPGRHGPGLNLFCYHLDGAGVLCEYTADVRHVMESPIERVSLSERDFYEAMTAASRTAAEAMQAWEQLEMAAKRLSKPDEADAPEGVPPPES